MSAYTKGPWKVSAEVTSRVVDDFATIAHCNVSSREYSETKANARLIAAAPELLNALKIARCAFLGHSEDGSYRGDGIKFSAGERALIESAIAKAEAL